MMLKRKFVDYDGNVLEETDWSVTPMHRCFYCDGLLVQVYGSYCPAGILGQHDFVTMCQKDRELR